MSLEQIAQTSGDGAVALLAAVLADAGREAGREREERRFCGEFLAGDCQRSVRAPRRGDEIDATGLIHDAASASLRNPGCVEVGDAFAEAGAVRCGATIVRDAGRDDYRFSALVRGIITSTPFQMRLKPRSGEGDAVARTASR